MQTRTILSFAAFVALGTVSGVARAQSSDTTKPPAPVAPSLYTDEQATRGEKVYTNVCVECHEKLEYTGGDFRVKWNGRPVFELYDLLRTTMPDSKPGSLPNQDYIDIIGYMMKLNGVAAGKVELAPTDSVLKAIKMDIPPPKDAPLFSGRPRYGTVSQLPTTEHTVTTE
jgi:mono/diheme cytochrome c family protein